MEPHDTPSATERGIPATHALVVLSGMANGRTRRHVYLNLPSAQLAVERAAARGLPASLHLVRLVPVPLVMLEDLPADVAPVARRG